jgi:hypothetical protein
MTLTLSLTRLVVDGDDDVDMVVLHVDAAEQDASTSRDGVNVNDETSQR